MGRIYQQTFIDTYAKVAFAKLYDHKHAITSADLLNDRVLPFYEKHDIPLLRVLTDRGTEYCGKREDHEYELYLSIEDIDHSKTKARHPQTNGICERFHRTIQDEFYCVTFRKKLYSSIDQLQQDVDLWISEYNNQRTHSGKYCFGKTPMQTWIDSLSLVKEKMLDRLSNFTRSGEAEEGNAEEQPSRNNLMDQDDQEGVITTPSSSDFLTSSKSNMPEKNLDPLSKSEQ
jgi:hypothetical protein